MKNLFIAMSLLISFNLSAAESNPSFWDSLWNGVQHQYEITVDYWTPIIKNTKETTVKYWKPRLRKAFDKSLLFFSEKVLPVIRKSYSRYMNGPGKQISENFMISFDYMVKKWKEWTTVADAYYRQNHPITYAYLTNVPAFVKKGYEKMIIGIWKWLYSLEEEKLKGVPLKHRASLSMAMAAAQALENRTDTPENLYLNKILDDVRWHAKDYGMQDCYQITLLNEPIMNAFNLGCNIFFSKDLLDILENNERLIRAVIAHEVAHGDRGHGIKTLGSLIGSGVKHYSQLTMEELVWLATGDVHQTFGRVANGEANSDLIMERFSPTAPQIEIDADVHAAEMLEEAGYRREDLIDALKLLHSIAGSLDCDQERLAGSSGRDYPTYCARRDAILAL